MAIAPGFLLIHDQPTNLLMSEEFYETLVLPYEKLQMNQIDGNLSLYERQEFGRL